MKKNYKSRVMIFATAALFTMGCFAQVLTKNVYATSGFQELLITEIMPMSQTTNDAYEYIELYNNSDRNIDLKDYKLPLQNMDITTSKVIAPKGTLVVCTKASTTLNSFNAFYGIALTADKYVTLPFLEEVLSNISNSSVLITKDDDTVVVRAQCNNTDFEAKKGVTYRYTDAGFDMLILGKSQSPTPGGVSVEQVPQSGIRVTGVTLDKSLITMDVNQTAIIYATVTPATATNKAIVWTSSNPSIVEVNQNGKLTSKVEGAVYVTATTVDGGMVATCLVTVQRVPVTGITLDKTSSSIEIGKSIILKTSVAPSNATNQLLNWASNNSSIASVDSTGKVVGKAIGQAIITVTTRDNNFKDTCVVTVKENKNTDNGTFGIRLNKTSIEIKAGNLKKLTPIITSGNLKKSNLRWKSSDVKIAYVSNDGKVFGIKEGEAVITLSTADGKYIDECSVKITSFKNKNKDKDKNKNKNKNKVKDEDKGKGKGHFKG